MAYFCSECGKELDVNERALNLRIVSRTCPDSELKCPKCLAVKFKTTEDHMREMIYRSEQLEGSKKKNRINSDKPTKAWK